MSYASRSGRARTSSKRPAAFAVCMRCGIWNNRENLHFQYDWRGTSLQNLYILVCDRCNDVPQEQLRAIQLPADPTPVYFPSVEAFQQDETNYRTTLPVCIDPITGIPYQDANTRVTQEGNPRVTQEIGAPNGLEQNAVMPYNGAIQRQFGVVLSPLSISSNGTATVTCTFSTAHGLNTGDQIAVQGLLNPLAAGFFSVTVISAMAFSYLCFSNVPAAGLLTGTTRMVTCLVGLPYGDAFIPQTGP